MSSCKDPSQPFPSPGSSFIPPPVPGPHEFAVRRSSPPRKMSKKDTDDAVANERRCNGSTTPTTNSMNGVAPSTSPSTFPNGVDPPSPPARDPPDPHPSASDPQLSLPSSHHSLSTQSVTSLTSSRPAPPSPAVSRRASGLSRTSSRPVSGMSSTTSSRPVSGAQHSRPVSGSGSRPASGTIQPTTPIAMTATTPVATTPRHPQDRRPNLVSASDLDPTPAGPTPTATQVTATASPTTTPAPIQIRDYGFAPTDPRFSGQGPHVPRANRPTVLARRLASSSRSTPTSSSEGDEEEEEDDDDDDDYEGEEEKMNVDVAQRIWEDIPDDGINGWGGFKWGFSRAWGFERMSGIVSDTGATPSAAGFPSRGDLDRNFGGEDECEDMEIDEEGEAISDGEGEGEGEPPLFPGLYRALYAFEPEGTAEMKLDEDQFVRVIGRGGGVGWAVVVKDGLKDTGVHALVPESYLEAVRLDGEEDA